LDAELKRPDVPISDNLAQDLASIFEGQESNVTPFMNLPCQEQQKLAQRSSKGFRFHPMIIRQCLSLASKSPPCNNALGSSNILSANQEEF